MKIGILLAALLVANPLPAAAVEAPQSPAEASWSDRFSATVIGSGPDVIMIPGLMSDREVWNSAVASLDGGYRVHLIQIGGFAGEPSGANSEGEILAPLVESLHDYIEAKGLDRPAVVGHSMGGMLGLMLAQAHPEMVGKLLVVDALPFYSLLFSPGATVEAVRPQAAAMRDGILAMDEASFAAQQSATMARLVRNEAARPELLADTLESDRKVAARAMFELMTTDARPALARVKAPVTVAFATNEHAPEAMVRPLFRNAYAGLAHATFEEVPDSNHFIMVDQPERFEALLAQFLARD